MNRLNKKQLDERSKLATALDEARADLELVITEFNEARQAAFDDDVVPKIDNVNEALSNVRAFTEEIHADIENYYNKRSDKWMEGDKGKAYSSWKDEWDISRDFDELGPPEVQEVEMPDVPEGCTLEDISEEPSM